MSLEPINVDISTGCAMLGIKRTAFYALLAEGKIEARKLGKRTLIPVASLKAFAAGLPLAREAA